MLDLVVLLLYSLCFALLIALVALIAGSPRRKKRRAHSEIFPALASLNRQRHSFLGLALSLLLWQLTLFLEARTTRPAFQLVLGRLNFAAVALAAFLAWRFVRHVADGALPSPATARGCHRLHWLRGETGLLTLLTLLTPLIDGAESVIDGHPTTRFGPLFPLYLLHVLGYLGAALTVALSARWGTTDPAKRARLTLIGGGMLATGGIALVTNALLPYGFADFRFCHVGTLSTFCFALAIAYATFAHGLFELKLVVRAALVYGVLLAFGLGGYSSAVWLITQYLTGSAGADRLTQFVVLLIAFSFDPLRRFLEDKTDRLLFGRKKEDGEQRRGRNCGGAGDRRLTAFLFPWRRN